jgi:FAD-dependent oxidoreductase family protein
VGARLPPERGRITAVTVISLGFHGRPRPDGPVSPGQYQDDDFPVPVPGTAILGPLIWRECRVVAVRPETDSARTLGLDVPDWPGHLPGQRLNLRLTAGDGYRAVRSYWIASAAGDSRVELTVQRTPGDEVSPYLVDIVEPGDRFEVRRPVGGHVVWDPDDPAPVALAAGGSGIVQLMAMIRTRARLARRLPFRLLYATRGPADVIYARESNSIPLPARVSTSPMPPAGASRPGGCANRDASIRRWWQPSCGLANSSPSATSAVPAGSSSASPTSSSRMDILLPGSRLMSVNLGKRE